MMKNPHLNGHKFAIQCHFKCIRISFALFLATFFILQQGLAQSENTTPLIPLNFGFPKTVLPDLNERDAKAAIKVWSEDVIEKHQYNYKTAFFLYMNVNTLVQAMTDGYINIAPLPPIDYIRLSKTFTLYPAVCAKNNDSVFDRFVFLVHKESRFASIQDLANKSLMLREKSPSSVLEVWLEVILHEAGLPGSNQFFGEIIRKEREFQLIFPVLLKKVDCCIMTQSAFRTMSELNPQLNVQLIPLLISDLYYPADIFCYTDQLDDKTRSNLTSFALNWEESKATDQLQTLFRFNELVPYKPEYLENIKLLLKRYNRYQ
jgi:ABC-type phosphate/phosphonate transport system substrate-binding protein